MSHITRAVVVTSVCEGLDQLEALNAALRQLGCQQSFRPLDTSTAGGGKVFSGQVWAASFNNIPSKCVRAAVLSVDWEESESVSLVWDEEDSFVSVDRVSDVLGTLAFFLGMAEAHVEMLAGLTAQLRESNERLGVRLLLRDLVERA